MIYCHCALPRCVVTGLRQPLSPSHQSMHRKRVKQSVNYTFTLNRTSDKVSSYSSTKSADVQKHSEHSLQMLSWSSLLQRSVYCPTVSLQVCTSVSINMKLHFTVLHCCVHYEYDNKHGFIVCEF